MAGANEVFLKQAGTGAAWMGPQSSFDPVLFAREAAYAKIGAEQGKKEEQQKAKEAFFSKLKINPEQVLATDAMTSQQEDLAALNDYLKEIMGANGWDMNMEQNAQYQTQLFAQKDKLRKAQESQYLKFKDLEKDKNLLGDEMEKNGQVWYAPEMYSGEEAFAPYQSEYDEIVKSVSQDPVYGRNKNSIIGHAKIIFRDKHPELLNPIQKPTSIPELWNKVKDIAVNEIKEVKGSDYNVKTDEYSSWDEDVEITDNKGNKRTIKSTKSNAIDIFNNDLDTQYSAKYYYDKATPEVKKQYEGSQNPVLDYYLDQVKGFSGDVTTSNVTKNVPKSPVFANGYSPDTDWDVEPIKELSKVTRVAGGRGTDDDVVAGVTTYGYNVTKNGENQLDVKDVANIPFYYDKNKDTHNKMGKGTTMSIAGAKPFMAATFNQKIDFNTFESDLTKMEYDKPETGTGTLKGKPIRNAYEDFLDKFGGKYEYAQKVGSLQGIIIGDDERSFLNKIGKGNWISGGKFVSGEGSYRVEKRDGTFTTEIIPEMVVPLSFVNDLIFNITKVDFNKALDSYKQNFKSINNFEGLQDNKEPETEGTTGGFDSKKTKVYDPNTTTTTTTTTTNTKQKGSNNGTLDSVWNYNTYDERKKYIKSINPAYEVYNQQDGSIKVFDPDTKEEIILTPTY
jgi:hypothetical protein